MPATTRQRAPFPRGHARDRASPANIAEAGAAGYSVTVAQPAASPTASAHKKSPRALLLSLTFNADAKAKIKQAPTSACAQNKLAYAHIGVPTDIASTANAAPLEPPPNRSPRKNKHTAASAAGNATAPPLATYDSATSPRADSGSTPIIRNTGLAPSAKGTARNTNPGALSE